MKNKWDKRFMDLAKMVATWSKDNNTQVGAVIVDNKRVVRSMGYNGFPRGVDDHLHTVRYERPLKYHFTAHAERNALDQSYDVNGCTIYSTYFPCADCARGIIQKGLVKIVSPEPNWKDEKWGLSWDSAFLMFEEAGINIEFYTEL